MAYFLPLPKEIQDKMSTNTRQKRRVKSIFSLKQKIANLKSNRKSNQYGNQLLFFYSKLVVIVTGVIFFKYL